jgi:hypothetical protein
MDLNHSRPGGKVVVLGDKIFRYAQDCDPNYGNRVWAFEVITLTKDDYSERRTGRKSLLKGNESWNDLGMHHISPCRTEDGGWIAGVDGFGRKERE